MISSCFQDHSKGAQLCFRSSTKGIGSGSPDRRVGGFRLAAIGALCVFLEVTEVTEKPAWTRPSNLLLLPKPCSRLIPNCDRSAGDKT